MTFPTSDGDEYEKSNMFFEVRGRYAIGYNLLCNDTGHS